MTYIANTNPASSTTREQIEIRMIIRDGICDAITELGKIVNLMERSGEYKDPELKESEEFVAFMEEREKLEEITKEILELKEKLRKEVEIEEEAGGWNRGRVR
ncbi:hypothetical protein B9Z19DRAFT_1067214 [Tuber borchii]|uniref:Uncharacterized protein n=1 Tax=Tuber borchii TaxID=42251 RepID=A0A2T6ZJP7_TUBBO|nr:hypothetical protein B9Z19DRAFT_1067214 [Tuber borchii]